MKINISLYLKNLFIYTISFCVGIFLITYILKIPHLVTGNYKIVNQYYLSNFTNNIPLDYLFVILYFLVGYIFIKIFKISNDLVKILIIALTTALLTGGFCYYFTSKELTSNFFSKWFHTVGYTSVLYDVILLVFIYIIYLYLDKVIKN
tara:strand:- start:375 stop:821 length:447 start_codon:yes stop_codon:yes gene_type:complete